MILKSWGENPKKKHKGAGHRERLRQRFLKGGLDGFLDYEIIEILLTLGTPRGDLKDAAKEAIARFKSLKGVLDAAGEELQEIRGIGPKNVLGLKLIREVAQAYLKEKTKDLPHSSSPAAVYNYLRYSLGGLSKEVFKILYLNNANKILEAKELFEGTIDQAVVHPREVVAAALRFGASRLIFAHNHTGGSLRPSPEDMEITAKLKSACAAVGIEVLDHIIVGGDGYFSFREHSLI